MQMEKSTLFLKHDFIYVNILFLYRCIMYTREILFYQHMELSYYLQSLFKHYRLNLKRFVSHTFLAFGRKKAFQRGYSYLLVGEPNGLSNSF